MQRKTLAARNLVIGLLALGLSGCAAVVVGGAVTTAKVAHDRRTTGSFVEDQEIFLKAVGIYNEDKELMAKSDVSISVYNMQVLLIGQAENMAIVEAFAQRVGTIPRVRGVFNEVAVGAALTFGESTSDAYLTAQVKVQLFDVKLDGFDPTRVKVSSSLGSVYLMGLLTPTEADAVVEKVRYISGVKRVVKLFEYLDE
jgi:osmotically-inducible protein OsmY